MNSNHIEVTIVYKNNKFVATANSFQKCKGTGTTQKEALESLGRAIARHVSTVLTASLNETLTSDRYTEIIFDSTCETPCEKRVFQLSEDFSDLHQTVMLNLKPIDVTIPAQQGDNAPISVDEIDFVVSAIEDIVSDISAAKVLPPHVVDLLSDRLSDRLTDRLSDKLSDRFSSDKLSDRLLDQKNQIKGFGFGFPLSYN